ncbi:MAG TPA: hypothetical protein VN673_10495 [Clostridia bacterium]|nr:hypothetical protein [Clostridia bacterium]
MKSGHEPIFYEDGYMNSMREPRLNRPWHRWAALAVMLVALNGAGQEPGSGETAPSKPAEARSAVEENFGIKILGPRVSAGGLMIDFRYKILDADKAARLASREVKPFMVDQASGAVLLVPRTPKLGALRHAGQKPQAGRVSFILFSNPGKVVKTGSQVSVVIGNCRIKNLHVE